jgi:hypothetical protein
MSWGSCYIQWSLCSHSVNMSAPVLDSTTAKQHVVIWFLWSEGKTLLDSQKNVSTTQKEMYWAQDSVSMGYRFQHGRKASQMKNDLGHLPLYKWQTTMNKLMLQWKRTDKSLSLIQPTSWTSAVDLRSPSSVRTLVITTFMQGTKARWAQAGHTCIYASNYAAIWNAFLQGTVVGNEKWVHPPL